MRKRVFEDQLWDSSLGEEGMVSSYCSKENIRSRTGWWKWKKLSKILLVINLAWKKEKYVY